MKKKIKRNIMFIKTKIHSIIIVIFDKNNFFQGSLFKDVRNIKFKIKHKTKFNLSILS